MALKEFVLPLCDNDLLGRDNKHAKQYIVTDITPTSEIAQKIKSVCSRVNGECSHLKLKDLITASVGPLVFVTNFDLFYSLLRDIEKVSVSTRGIAWDCCVQTLSKCVNIVSKQQTHHQWEDEDRAHLRRALKMSCFILVRMLEFYEDKVKSAAAVSLALSVPSKKRKKAAVVSSNDVEVDREDWAVERDRALQLLADMINCDALPSLWASHSSSSTPAVDDALVNLLIKAVCLCLSNSDLSAASKSALDSNSCNSILRLCAKVINMNPNQLPVLASHVIYLLRNNEKSLTSVIELSVGLVETHQHTKFIFEILREIGSCDAAEFCQDSESTKTLTSFLVQLAAKLPHLFFKWFFFLLPHFQEESYSFRMALCTISGEVLQYAFQAANSKASTSQPPQLDNNPPGLQPEDQKDGGGQGFTEQQKKSRDELFEELQLHVHDVHANVRARAMATLSHLLETGLIPLDNAVELLLFVAPSVDDVASSVRKNCLQLLAHFIAVYPFAFKYRRQVFETLLKDEKLALQEITKSSNKQAQQAHLMTREEAEKKWEDMSEQLVKHLVKQTVSASNSSSKGKRRLHHRGTNDDDEQEEEETLDEEDKENGNETKEECESSDDESMETNEDKLARLLSEVRAGLESGNFKEAISSIEKALLDHPTCPLFVAAANNPTLREDQEDDEEEEEREQKTPASILGKKRVVMLHDLMKAVYIAPFAKLSVSSNEAADKMLSLRNLRRRSLNANPPTDQASSANSPMNSSSTSHGRDLAEMLERLPTMNDEQIEELIRTQRNKILLIQKCVKIQRVFCKQVLPACWNLLGSPTGSDVTTAIEFLVICVQFGLDVGSAGISRLNSLLACPDAAVRAAVVSAFQRIYFEQSVRTQEVAQNLISLAKEDGCGGTLSDWLSLQSLVCEFVKLGHMNEKVINYLWEVVTLKHNDIHTEQDRLLAVALLGMAAKEKPAIVTSNLNVLIKFTLAINSVHDVTQGSPKVNFFLANEALKALLVTCQSEQYERLDDSLRLAEHHELVNCISALLVTGLRYSGTAGWIEFVGSAVATIFTLVRDPLAVMNNILIQCHPENIVEVCTKEGEEEAGNKSDLNEELLRRFLCLLGHVAQNTAAFLEVNVMNEVEFQKKKRDAEKELKRASKRATGGTSANVSAAALDKSAMSRRGPTGRRGADGANRQSMANSVASTTMSSTMCGESSGLTNNAMNEWADMIKAICDDTLVTGPGVLAKFVPFVKACLLPVGAAAHTQRKKTSSASSPLQGHPSPALRSSATVTLSKFMLTSESMCRENLQLLFTIMEKDPDAVIRSNVINLTADLLIRFPNAVAPWTPNIYARLHDRCDDVRLNCVITVSQLVLKEQIKVKGQISEMAKCTVDPNLKIASHSKRLFEELAKKNNTLYNVLADIISRLSGHSADSCHDDAEKQLIDDVMDDDVIGGNDMDDGGEGDDESDGWEEDNQEGEGEGAKKRSGSKGSQFNQIIAFIIKLLPREKLSELLVDKMCQRFKIVSSSARQCRNLGFVLSLLHYNEKAFNKLQDHLPTYAPVLRNNKALLRYLLVVIENCKKNCKPEMKQTITELESRMEAAYHGEDKDNQQEGDQKENEENIGESPPTSSQRRAKQSSSNVSSEVMSRASRHTSRNTTASSITAETPRPRRGTNANVGVTPDIGKSVNKNKKGVASKAKPRRRAAMLDYSASSLEEDEGEKRSLEDTEESSQSDEEVEKKKVEKKPPTSVTRKTSARNAKNMNDTNVSSASSLDSSSLNGSVRRSTRNMTLSPLVESNRQPEGKRTRRK